MLLTNVTTNSYTGVTKNTTECLAFMVQEGFILWVQNGLLFSHINFQLHASPKKLEGQGKKRDQKVK